MSLAIAPPRTPPAFVALATLVAAAAQVGFVAIFELGHRPTGRADIDVTPPGEIPVAIDTVSELPLLKYGSSRPVPSPAHAGAIARSTPATPSPARPPPTPAVTTTPPISPEPSSTEAPAAAPTESAAASSEPAPPAGAPSASADAGPSTAATTPGSELGSDAGTEIDPLKARAAASYRAELDAWFSARFRIRGKIPFDRLEKLAASAVVSVSDARRVVGFTIASPSGDPVFDAQLSSDLSAIQASGVELPAPPPEHPELLGSTVHLRFACAIRAACE